jgi:hypothetical protein
VRLKSPHSNPRWRRIEIGQFTLPNLLRDIDPLSTIELIEMTAVDAVDGSSTGT